MQYESPLGGVDLSGYIDPNPATGTEGSRVRAPAVENHQRELVYLIEQSGQTPTRADLTQVYQSVVALIAAASRRKLTANLDYWVSAAGSDSNNGLSALTPFLTIQKAIDTLYKLDLNGFQVKIRVADGTYTTPVNMGAALVGEGSVVIEGNVTTPANVEITVTNGNCITVNNGAKLTVQGVALSTITAGNGVVCSGGRVHLTAIRFRTTVNWHMHADSGGKITLGTYTISGPAQVHLHTGDCGQIEYLGSGTVTIINTPNFSVSFANAINCSVISVFLVTFSGAATGVRFFVGQNASIYTFGQLDTYLPGNSGGSEIEGGVYS